jgi:hypothetical protein
MGGWQVSARVHMLSGMHAALSRLHAHRVMRMRARVCARWLTSMRSVSSDVACVCMCGVQVNYLLGVFDASNGGDGESSVALPSTGVVEMGGSSMQITFAPLSPSAQDRSQLIALPIAGRTYWLYTHSFLQYGLQAAERLYQRLSMNEIEAHGNPCYPRSFRHSSIGDFTRCTELLAAVVDKSAQCLSNSCSFNGVYQPRIGLEPFVAIENFYYTAKFFGNADEPTTVGAAAVAAAPKGNQLITSLRASGHEFCNTEWSSLVSTYTVAHDATPAKATPEELSAFCFSAAYQTVVLESGLGFDASVNVRVAKNIRGKGIDWEMGAVIFELIAPSESARGGAGGATSENGVVQPAAHQRKGITLEQENLANEGGYCRSCAVYTLVFAVVVVGSYLAYARYAKRGANAMTPYSQSSFGFNRV